MDTTFDYSTLDIDLTDFRIENGIPVHPDLDAPEVQLVGGDAHAVIIMATAKRALKRAGNSAEVIDAYSKLAMASDYDHLLAVTDVYCIVS